MAQVEFSDSDRIVLRLDEDERSVLRSLAEQLIGLVGPQERVDDDPLAAIIGIDAQASKPDDPAVLRLLPDAYLDDEEAADDFRRFTERSLREGKVAHARAVIESLERSGDKVTLSDGEVASWLGMLNDARLALGVRLEITEDARGDLEDLDDEDPRAGWAEVYDWLTYVQDSLLQLLVE